MKTRFNRELPLPSATFYNEKFKLYTQRRAEYQNYYNLTVGAPEVSWDAWVDVMRELPHANIEPEGDFNRNTEAGRIRLLSQFSGNYQDDLNDRLLRKQYAFTYGFLQQSRIVEMIYENTITCNDLIRFSAEMVNDAEIEGETQESVREQARKLITKIGSRGLRSMGGAAGLVIGWSKDVYPESQELSRLFRIGHGVALDASRLAHETFNLEVTTEYTQSKIFSGTANDTGEES